MPSIQRTWIKSVAAFAVLFHLFFAGFGQAQEPEGIYFFDDYNKALQESKRTKKPIFLEFRCAP